MAQRGKTLQIVPVHRSPKPILAVVHVLVPASASAVAHHILLHDEAVTGPRVPLGNPVWKPFLNFLATVLRYRIRPVPVVFLRFAFSDQLSRVPPCQQFNSLSFPIRMAGT